MQGRVLKVTNGDSAGGLIQASRIAGDVLPWRVMRFYNNRKMLETDMLWFEHNLLDQLQILQILDWRASPEEAHPGLHLICISTFEGMPRFRGLGKRRCNRS